MIVGEPSLMGGEMDDEDERYISRLENTQYESASTQQISQGYQQNPNLQSLLHQKPPFTSNSSQLLNPNQMKREQISFPASPQQQLPSMFSNNPPTPINGEVSTTGKRISTSPQTSSINNHNQV
jgi:hypothetical protein